VSPDVAVSGSVAAAFALGLACERVAPHESVRPTWTVNLGVWIAALTLRTLAFGGAEWEVAGWAEASGFGLLHLARAPLALSVAASVLGLDLVSYLWHRANHSLPLLWRFHRVHHADPAVHVSSALRFHAGEILLSVPVRLAAIALLGAPLVGVAVFEAVFGAANALEHGSFDLPAPIERGLGLALITPALHRRHHSVLLREHDANYGTIFSFWDRLGRSALPNTSSEHFALGLPENEVGDPRSLRAMLVEPFRATR
jgi:sterol desaturase/sphingolipid hydroxylase (fatty acid hydroxylase superfamily)